MHFNEVYENDSNNGTNKNNRTCIYTIELTSDYDGDVKFYYGLENYYQNMRLYVRSRNDDQLQGLRLDETEDCHPYETVIDQNGRSIPIVPCGAVANSLFNDTFELFYQENNTLVTVPWTTKDLIDPKLYKKYVNPPHGDDRTLCEAFRNTSKPPHWSVPVCELYDDDGGYGFQNFDFIMWMQTAALPRFRKLYRGLNKTNIFQDGLPKGTYVLKITDSK